MEPSGLRISWASWAAISPTAASFSLMRTSLLQALDLGQVLEDEEVAAAARLGRRRERRDGDAEVDAAGRRAAVGELEARERPPRGARAAARAASKQARAEAPPRAARRADLGGALPRMPLAEPVQVEDAAARRRSVMSPLWMLLDDDLVQLLAGRPPAPPPPRAACPRVCRLSDEVGAERATVAQATPVTKME